MTELICIVCPKGCHLHIDEANGYAVTGNSCEKGEAYGKKELTDPRRVLTSTVRLEGGSIRRLPVKTNGEIPKREMFRAAEALNCVVAAAPVLVGDVVVPNLLGLGVDIVATKSISAV